MAELVAISYDTFAFVVFILCGVISFVLCCVIDGRMGLIICILCLVFGAAITNHISDVGKADKCARAEAFVQETMSDYGNIDEIKEYSYADGRELVIDKVGNDYKDITLKRSWDGQPSSVSFRILDDFSYTMTHPSW